jgi:hypothetical protein
MFFEWYIGLASKNFSFAVIILADTIIESCYDIALQRDLECVAARHI